MYLGIDPFKHQAKRTDEIISIILAARQNFFHREDEKYHE
jgi:hypothetical protein